MASPGMLSRMTNKKVGNPPLGIRHKTTDIFNRENINMRKDIPFVIIYFVIFILYSINHAHFFSEI